MELLKPLSSTEALVGETATFTCQLSKPNKDVVWKVGDKVVTASDDKFEVESSDVDYTLKVKDCTLDDAGDVSLTIGDVQTSAQLVVAGERRSLTSPAMRHLGHYGSLTGARAPPPSTYDNLISF